MQSNATSCSLAALILMLSSGYAKPLPTSFVHRTIDCGRFVVEADTLLTRPNDDFETQGLSQTIHIIDSAGHRSIRLPLFQHFSKSRKFNGRLILDGLVYAWDCRTTRSGETYVMLSWSCINLVSKACESQMGIRKEWIALYDVNGRPVPPNPLNFRLSDQRRIRKMGLWEQFTRPDSQKSGVTYFPQ